MKKSMNKTSAEDLILIENLRVRCIIGIFKWERKSPQTVSVNLSFPCDVRRAAASDRIQDAVDYKKVSKAVSALIEGSRFFLLETLAEKIAELCLSQFHLSFVSVSAAKPGALRGADNVRVSIHRTRESLRGKTGHTAHLSIGSNINPDTHVTRAVCALAEYASLVRISSVYQTQPYGMAKQDDFWNVAVEICTALREKKLKRVLKQIEKKAGRRRGQNRYGPRTLDIDIIFFDGRRTEDQNRHTRSFLAEQGFILVPLAEIAPDLKDPDSGKTLIQLLGQRAYGRQIRKRLGSWPVSRLGKNAF